jgi:tRNA threonylcarbamoyladenosine biosynthesis protein TsaB
VRILALETSSAAGSAAALEDERLVAQTQLPAGQRSAQSLAPAIAATLAAAVWRPQDVQLVAVTQGPGSFTGLRVGAATAKPYAYAAGAEILGVNTLEVIAAQAPVDCGKVWALLDAHRGQLFVGRYALREGEIPVELEATRIETLENWLARYHPEDAVTGPGVSRIAARLPAKAAVVERGLWTPQAATVGMLASRHYRQGRRDDVWTFVPQYYRPSAAEEKHAAHPEEPRDQRRSGSA